ncbi:MAG: inositol monophosphatase [Oscillospiraceae bacterium]|nr:inositol monophosphatase [Oscillospiraceae bacterium]
MLNKELLEKVVNLAREAGKMVLNRENTKIIEKDGVANFVTPTDIAISNFLSEELPKILAGSKIISEESKHNARYDEGYVWVLDPIDGTNNFIYELGLSVISIGLFSDGIPSLGVIYNPYRDEVYTGIRGKGAWWNGKRIQVNQNTAVSQTMVMLETGSCNPREENATFAPLKEVFRDCIDYRVSGCSAMDICYVASGKVSVFFSELISIWDYAAALTILNEAGGKATRWDGSPLDHTHSGTILVTNGILHDEMLRRIHA